MTHYYTAYALNKTIIQEVLTFVGLFQQIRTDSRNGRSKVSKRARHKIYIYFYKKSKKVLQHVPIML